MDRAAQKKYCDIWMFEVSEPDQKLDSTKSESTSAKTAPTQTKKQTRKPYNTRRKPTPKRTPRPLNEFMLYRKARRSDVVAQNKNLSTSEVSKIISIMWKRESDEERYKWKIRANEMRIKHTKDYPDYFYQPRKAGIKKQKRRYKPILPDETIAAIAEAAFAVNNPNNSQLPMALPSSPPSPTILPSPTISTINSLHSPPSPPMMPPQGILHHPLSSTSHVTFHHPHYAQHPDVSPQCLLPNYIPQQSFNPIEVNSYISPHTLTSDNLDSFLDVHPMQHINPYLVNYFYTTLVDNYASDVFNNNDTFISYDNCGYGDFQQDTPLVFQ